MPRAAPSADDPAPAETEIYVAEGAAGAELKALIAQRHLRLHGKAASAETLQALIDQAPGDVIVVVKRSAGDLATAGTPETPALTSRELEVLNAMADGASNKAIARRLGISFHTVKFHVAAILEKLDAESRTEAVAEAARLGLVML